MLAADPNELAENCSVINKVRGRNMNKIYISSLLVVLLAGAQTIRAQDGLDSELKAEVETANLASVDGEANSSGEPEISSERLLERATELYQAEKYNEARAVFEAVLTADPYNRKAMNYLSSTADKVGQLEKRKAETTRAVAIADIKQEWNTELSNAVGAAIGASKPDVKTAEDVAIEQMVAHLKSIVIPTLDFRDANIKDVVLYLTEACRRIDAAGDGVNIILLGLDSSDAMGGGALGNNITISIRNMNIYDALQYIVEMAALKFQVGSNVVTIMPVNYVRSVDVVIESFQVIPEVGEELSSMAEGEDSGGGMDDLFGGDSGSSSSDMGPVDVSKYFSIVPWPEGASVVYYPNFRKLVVKNTPDNIESVGQILGDLEFEAVKKRSQQVLIEAKFVEFNEGALEELGFNWNIYGSGTAAGFNLIDGTTYAPASGYAAASQVKVDDGGPIVVNPNTGQITGGANLYTQPVGGYYNVQGEGDKQGESLFGGGRRSNECAFVPITSGLLSRMGGVPADMFFSNGDVDLTISAMEQNGTADVLSTPKVTTQSGYEAVIRVTEIHRYPQDWDVETGQRTAPVVKPQDWEDFDLGVVLRVTPEVDPESNTIKLEIAPEIRKFLGFDRYFVAQNSYDGGTTDFVVPAGDGSNLFALMPFFEIRSVQTRVTVADGNTVMMGGLVDERVETFRDQVPILGDLPYIGRLFRTEGSRSVKKNLVIYVKATQVDERGMTREDREIAGRAAGL
jgi:general secretion pathway protein D